MTAGWEGPRDLQMQAVPKSHSAELTTLEQERGGFLGQFMGGQTDTGLLMLAYMRQLFFEQELSTSSYS